MKTLDIITRAGRNLRLAKTRTFLTAVAISVGAFAIVVSLAAGEGARQYVNRVISANMDKQSIQIGKDPKLFDSSGGMQAFGGLKEYDPDMTNSYGVDIKSLNESDINRLKQRKDIKNIEIFYQIQPKFITFTKAKNPSKEYTSEVQPYQDTLTHRVEAGQLPALHQQIADNGVVLPSDYLEVLGISNAQSAIGTDVSITVEQPPQAFSEDTLQGAFMSGGAEAVKSLTEGKTLTKTLKIVAVEARSAEQMTQPAYLSVSSGTARELSEFTTKGTNFYQKYMFVAANVTGNNTPEQVKQSLEKDGFYAATAKDIQKMLFTFVNLLQSIVLGFGLLALIVSIFGIINTQYISVLERTQQIGLMKALGASRRDIARLFRYEAAWVGALGGLMGVVIAWGAGLVANPWITQKLNLGEGNSLLIFEPLSALGVIVLLVIVAIVAGWLPSRKASRLDPIEALRTE